MPESQNHVLDALRLQDYALCVLPHRTADNGGRGPLTQQQDLQLGISTSDLRHGLQPSSLLVDVNDRRLQFFWAGAQYRIQLAGCRIDADHPVPAFRDNPDESLGCKRPNYTDDRDPGISRRHRRSERIDWLLGPDCALPIVNREPGYET